MPNKLLSMWTYFSFSSNAFCFLCEIREYLFQKKVEELFESATRQNGESFYTLKTINDAVPLNKKTMSNIIQLRLEKERIEDLNEWALSKETKESGFPVPMVSQYLNWKAIVVGGGHEKGVYMTCCEAVWHGLEN